MRHVKHRPDYRLGVAWFHGCWSTTAMVSSSTRPWPHRSASDQPLIERALEASPSDLSHGEPVMDDVLRTSALSRLPEFPSRRG